MANSSTDSQNKRQRPDVKKFLKLLAAAVAVAAVIKELRMPKEKRTWHGALGGFVPYDFRKPTAERIKSTFWDPDGTIIVNRAFGVGWSINFGAIVSKLRSPSSTG